jgi:metallo-beta-lactamase class B
MNTKFKLMLPGLLFGVAIVGLWAKTGQEASTKASPPPQNRGGRGANPNEYPNQPTIWFGGEPETPRSISYRNDGDQQLGRTPMPPHKIIGNLYSVGSQTLASYLIHTQQGNILVNTTYEENVRPVIEKGIQALGFKVADVKIVLNNHAHSDHAEGDALFKQDTGGKAQVMVMAEDEALLKTILPGGKEHPIDKVFHDGDTISLGGTTLTAHLTPGHTSGATTYTLKETEGGKTYEVVLFTSMRLRSDSPTGPDALTPEKVLEYNRSFKWVSTLKCDVPLGDHVEEYLQREKYAKLKSDPKGPNPYIDPEDCRTEAHLEEAHLHAVIDWYLPLHPGVNPNFTVVDPPAVIDLKRWEVATSAEAQ